MDKIKILFVVDQFADVPRDTRTPTPGGAEMTDSALIAACPWTIEPVLINELKTSHLTDFNVHILGNLSRASRQQIRDFSLQRRHILFEHDVRICRYRGNFPEAREPIHRFAHRCFCPHLKLRSLYASALGTIFLTYRQLALFKSNPFFFCRNQLILGGSAMSRSFFERVEHFWKKRNVKKEGTCVVYAEGPGKGFRNALTYCESRGIEPKIIRNLSPEAVLDVFEHSSRFVFLPESPEAAGRMPLEARFLGCEVVTNRYVGVAGEPWWNLDDESAWKFVRDIPARFWRLAKHLYDRRAYGNG
jgi:hypothetical protein